MSFALTPHGLEKVGDFTARVRTAIERGLARDQALAALTITPAGFLGLSERLGTVAEQVARVTPSDIQKAVQEHLDPNDAYLTCVGVLDEGLLSDVRGLTGA